MFRLASVFDPVLQRLINTVASARCKCVNWNGELFQQFVRLPRKPLKRLVSHDSLVHRAKAPMLMRGAQACHCFSALLGFIFLLACQSALRSETNAVTLRATAQVDANGIFLHQVLGEDWNGSTTLLLAPAPAFNQTVVLSRAQISAAVGRQDSSLVLTNWLGADKVKVTRRTRSLEEGKLKDLLTSTLQREQARDKGELELHLGRPWSAVAVPDEPLTVRVLDLPTAGLTPNFVLRFELRTEHETLGTYQMPLQAQLWRELWVARSPQPRGRLLRDADLTTERRDLLLLRDALVTVDFTDPALELAENLSIGAPLLLRSVRVRPVILRGKLVEAVVQDGAMMISVKVEALENGVPGQLIRVRNAKSKREFVAKVQNEQTVLVSL